MYVVVSSVPQEGYPNQVYERMYDDFDQALEAFKAHKNQGHFVTLGSVVCHYWQNDKEEEERSKR